MGLPVERCVVRIGKSFFIGVAYRASCRSECFSSLGSPIERRVIALTHTYSLPFSHRQFTTQLRRIITTTLSEAASPPCSLAFEAAQSVHNYAKWLDCIVGADGGGEGGDGSSSSPSSSLTSRAIKDLSGVAIISTKNAAATAATSLPLAQMHFSYPSHLTIALPRRETVSGSVGVTLDGVALDRVAEVLREEMRVQGARAKAGQSSLDGAE